MQNKKVKLKRTISPNRWGAEIELEQLPAGMEGEIIGRVTNYYGSFALFRGLDDKIRYIRDIDLEPVYE